MKRWLLLAIGALVFIGAFYVVFSQKNGSEKRAIELAKNSHEKEIRDFLSRQKGSLKVIGWKGKRIENNTYFVSFTYDMGAGEVGYFYEVILHGKIVRRIIGDTELEKKYGIRDVTPEPKERETIRLPLSYGEVKTIWIDDCQRHGESAERCAIKYRILLKKDPSLRADMQIALIACRQKDKNDKQCLQEFRVERAKKEALKKKIDECVWRSRKSRPLRRKSRDECLLELTK